MTDGAAGGGEAASWLSIAEAARATGWNPERLRSLARRGTIVTRRGNRGLEVYVAAGRPHGQDGRPLADGRAPDAGADDAGDDRADRLEATVERLRGDLARAEREAADLRVDLALAEERVRAVEAVARSDVEAAKRVVEAELAAKDEVLGELRSQVAREVARGEQLAAELALLRRPWWRRLWG